MRQPTFQVPALLGLLALACSSEPAPRAADSGADASDGPGADAAIRDAASPDGASIDDAAAGGRDAALAEEPSGQIRGRLLGFEPADARSIVISAGGSSSAPTAEGFFFLGGVRAGRVQLFARAPGYTTAHARLAVREGATSAIVLEVAKVAAQLLDDPSAAREINFGDESAPDSLQLSAASLRTAYGTAPRGATSLRAARLSARHAPAGLLARVDGQTVALRALRVVELSAWQPQAALDLSKPARLSLRGIAAVDGEAPQLFRFDEAQGLFARVAGATYAAEDRVVGAELELLGIYAAALPAAARGCSSGRLATPEGEPLVGAALRYTAGSNEESGLAWTGPDGGFCVALSAGETLAIEALGLHEGRVFEAARPDALVSEGEAACGGTSCNDLGTLTAALRPVGCVRGRVAAPGSREVPIASAVGAGESLGPSASVKPGEAFCLDLTNERVLEVTASGLRCGDARALPEAGRATSCAEDGCSDVGEIFCCSGLDLCGDRLDGDCDDRVDEGCDCGSSCLELHTQSTAGSNYCCTDSSACGFRYPPSDPVDHCFAYTESAPYTRDCPAEQLTVRGNPLDSLGCCRSDGQCGLIVANHCLARSEAQLLGGVSLQPIACTYPSP